MLLKTKGISHRIEGSIVAKVTRDYNSEGADQILISENDIPIKSLKNFKAVITNTKNDSLSMPYVSSVLTLEHLHDGDIVLINSDGVINTLYRVNSYQNYIFTTDRCNSNCLMCSQPPKDRDDIDYRFNINKQLISLIPKDCMEIGITGGEPTLMGSLFFELLKIIKTELPDTEVHCLTNGRAFAWPNFAEELGKLDFTRLMLGIPLYSDYYLDHDYVVQAKNAWQQTIQGLYNLAFSNVRIEIRVVLQKPTIPRLTKLAKYIAKNLPFVEHIALMGLEYQGYTPHNINKLWIDPVEYMAHLQEAAEHMSDFGLNVSIYNSQLCLMPKDLWKYNKKSISDWKNVYLEECSKCSRIHDCGGLFDSNKKMHSQFIKAFEL